MQKVRHHRPKSALTACTHTVSGSISLPSPGFFSPFPHGTGSLSVGREYLALEDGPPMFRQGFTCLALLDFISNADRKSTRLKSSHVAISYAVFCLNTKTVYADIIPFFICLYA